MDNTIYRNHVIVISSGKKTIVFGHGFACDQNSQFAEDIKKTFTNEDPDIMQYFARATFLSDYRKELKLVTAPTMILQCSMDSIVPIEVAEYINRNIKNSVLKIINSRGHYPLLSMPQLTAECILNYIKE